MPGYRVTFSNFLAISKCGYLQCCRGQ